jgi:Superinfection immunity protein
MLGSTALEGLAGIYLVLGIYILPTLLAWYRGHPNRENIATFNCLLGWTGFGWIAALTWACTRPPMSSLRMTMIQLIPFLGILWMLTGCATLRI